jgi:hypothetical protein
MKEKRQGAAADDVGYRRKTGHHRPGVDDFRLAEGPGQVDAGGIVKPLCTLVGAVFFRYRIEAFESS